MTDDEFVLAFESGALAPADFDHAAHLRMAFALLARRPFLEACIAMRDGLRALARRAGREGLYHETITVAFMSIVLDRMRQRPELDWPAFIALNADLADRCLLARYYREPTLRTDAARERFVLADAAGVPTGATSGEHA
jgi:hypothetical protein